jgi:hypothetical protein
VNGEQVEMQFRRRNHRPADAQSSFVQLEQRFQH